MRFILAVVLATGFGSVGCGTSLQDAKAPALAFVDCAAKALAPVVGSYDNAVKVAADVQSKRVTLAEVLDTAHATEAQAISLKSALSECIAAALADAGAPDAQ